MHGRRTPGPVHAAAWALKMTCCAQKTGSGQGEVLWMCRQAVMEALSPLGELNKGFYGGDAIYVWAKLPAGRKISFQRTVHTCPRPAHDHACRCLT
jgi:hypothetical protein